MTPARVAFVAAPLLAGVLAALPPGFAQTSVTPPAVKPAVPQQPVQQPGRGRTGQPPPPLVYTGLIMGRVVDSTTNQGVAGAIVTLSGGPSQQQPPRTAGAPPVPFFPPSPPRLLTDAQGRFAFRNLARGYYTLTAEKSGYSSGAFGRSAVGRPSRQLQMDDGERAIDVTVRVFRLGSISGRVVDEAGEPVVNVQVRTYRRTWMAGRRILTPANTTSTDDRGMYRIFNLDAGERIVAVQMSSTSSPGAAQSTADARQNFSQTTHLLTGPSPLMGGGRQLTADGRFYWQSGFAGAPLIQDAAGRWRAFATQYYSGARLASGAQPVTITPGEDRPGVDFVMPYLPTSHISGSLMGPNGPAANFVLRLIPSDAGEFTSEFEAASAATDAFGNFMFLAVPAGQYVIQTAKVPQQAPPVPAVAAGGAGVPAGRGGQVQLSPTSEPLWWAVTPVSVGDSDVEGVSLTLREGLSVSGRLEFAGSRPRPTAAQLSSVPIVLEPADGRDTMQSGAPSRVLPDGRFMTTGKLPGRYFIRIGGMPSGWIVQSIEAGGVDALERPIDLTSESVTGVVVTFTDQIGNIRGAVTGIPPGSDPPSVLLIPADVRGWTDFGINPWPQRRFTVNAATSTYNVGQISGGDYLIAAIRAEFATDWQDPAFLQAISRVAQRVTLGSGERRVIDIPLSDVRPPASGRSPAPASPPVSAPWPADTAPAATEPRDRGPAAEDAQQALPPRDTRAAEPVGTASISGRVMQVDDASRPARLAKVSVRGGTLSGERSALTDDEGRYVVAWLPPGAYTVTVSKPAYLNSAYGATGIGTGAGTRITLAAGQNLTSIDVTIHRGAVISGIITDPMGLPVTNVRVQPMAIMMRDGERILANAGAQGSLTTDDRGIYRAYGLRSGTYFLSVTPATIGSDAELRQFSDADLRAALADASKGPSPAVTAVEARAIAPTPMAVSPPPATATGRTVGYTPTFYPGVARDQDAAEIVLAAGQELNGVNIQLQMVATSRIGGSVIGPDGQPARNARVNLQRIGLISAGAPSVRVSEGGFQASAVPAGRYMLTAQMPVQQPPQSPGTPMQQTTYWAQQEVEVFGDDLLNVTMQLVAPFRITGRVVFDGAPLPEPKLVQVRLETAGRPIGGFPTPAPVLPDASGFFTINNVFPGRYRLAGTVSTSVTAGSLTAWTVESSTIEGLDSLIAPFEVRGDRQLSSAIVRLTTKPADLSGTLVDGQNAPVERMVVAIFPTDPALWSMTTSRGVRTATTGADGAYRFSSLIPRDYLLVVLTEMDLSQWGQTAYMEQLAAAALKVTIAPGEKKTQNMRVK